MPTNEINLRLLFDERDHQALRLAATIEDSPNLRAWATRTLLDHARRIVTGFQSKPTEGGEPCPPT